jgi:hypothetical protein
MVLGEIPQSSSSAIGWLHSCQRTTATDTVLPNNIRNMEHTPTQVVHASTIVNILVVHEIAGIERPHFDRSLGTQYPTTARKPLYVRGSDRHPHQPTGKTQSVQQPGVHPFATRGGERAHGALYCSSGRYTARPYHADARLTLKHIHEVVETARRHHHIWIDEGQPRCGASSRETRVDPRGEATIHGEPEDITSTQESFGEVCGAIDTGVVHDDDSHATPRSRLFERCDAALQGTQRLIRNDDGNDGRRTQGRVDVSHRAKLATPHEGVNSGRSRSSIELLSGTC